MFPGVNPKMMKQAMKKMGMQQVDIDATQVIIKTPEKNLIIDNPEVAKVTAMGQETFQISGEVREEAISSEPDISEDDIQTVMDQTNCSEQEAKEAIEKSEGDLAQAILELKKE
ncbi:MAG: nascent polypeptide-associated complex protein [Candidatus Woesearchaeota archaeon]